MGHSVSSGASGAQCRRSDGPVISMMSVVEIFIVPALYEDEGTIISTVVVLVEVKTKSSARVSLLEGVQFVLVEPWIGTRCSNKSLYCVWLKGPRGLRLLIKDYDRCPR